MKGTNPSLSAGPAPNIANSDTRHRLGGPTDHGVEFGQGTVHFCHQRLAARREMHAGLRSFEQRQSQFVFQPPDAPANGRCLDAE